MTFALVQLHEGSPVRSYTHSDLSKVIKLPNVLLHQPSTSKPPQQLLGASIATSTLGPSIHVDFRVSFGGVGLVPATLWSSCAIPWQSLELLEKANLGSHHLQIQPRHPLFVKTKILPSLETMSKCNPDSHMPLDHCWFSTFYQHAALVNYDPLSAHGECNTR